MKHLFVLGDSISIQYGPALHQMLRGRFIYSRKGGLQAGEAEIESPAIANGGDSSLVLSYLREQASTGFHTDILLLNFGLHDIKQRESGGPCQVPAEQYEQNLIEIRALALTLAEQVIWIRTTLLDDARHTAHCKSFHRLRAHAEAYNAIADRVMGVDPVKIADLSGFTDQLGGEVYCDHVHFTEEVRRLQAAFLAGSVWHFAETSP